jgi:hypothetical protein
MIINNITKFNNRTGEADNKTHLSLLKSYTVDEEGKIKYERQFITKVMEINSLNEITWFNYSWEIKQEGVYFHKEKNMKDGTIIYRNYLYKNNKLIVISYKDVNSYLDKLNKELTIIMKIKNKIKGLFNGNK